MQKDVSKAIPSFVTTLDLIALLNDNIELVEEMSNALSLGKNTFRYKYLKVANEEIIIEDTYEVTKIKDFTIHDGVVLVRADVKMNYLTDTFLQQPVMQEKIGVLRIPLNWSAVNEDTLKRIEGYLAKGDKENLIRILTRRVLDISFEKSDIINIINHAC